jgi:hypothetical protein
VSKSPPCELRARQHNPTDPFAVSYKVYANGRLKGAIIPIEDEGEDGARWESIAVDGSVHRWRYRNQARDFLCALEVSRPPSRS